MNSSTSLYKDISVINPEIGISGKNLILFVHIIFNFEFIITVIPKILTSICLFT